jgi:hypothetical protein
MDSDTMKKLRLHGMWQFVQRQSTRRCPQVFFCVPVLEL